MLDRLGRLAAQPAFRAQPFSVMWRAGLLAAHVGLGRQPTFRLTRGGERLRTPCDLRYTTVTAYLLRDWVEPELRVLDGLLNPGDVFVDVGANIGLYTLKAARLVGPTGVVAALEPGAEAFRQLVENLELNDYDWVRLLKVAASDAEGEAVLHHVPLGDDPQAFSLVAHPEAVEGERVRTVRLDDLALELGLDRIDLVKIDVEGAEPLVLDGSSRVLSELRPDVLFECNAHINSRGVATDAAGDAWSRLERFGYRFFRLDGDVFRKVDRPPADFCNLLARHPGKAGH